MNNMEEIKGMLIILEIAVIAVMVIGMALLHRKIEKVRLEVDWLVDDVDRVLVILKDVFDKVEAMPDENVGAAVEKLAHEGENDVESGSD